MRTKFEFLKLTATVVITWIASIGVVQADDTEIYQAEADVAESGRPKVLIVIDDSGSMGTEVEGQRPAYDPDAEYQVTFEPGRIYWSTSANVPDDNDDEWFEASQNRCAASFTSLDAEGQFTTERARRWRAPFDESEEVCGCPDSHPHYRNPPGPHNAGCYAAEEQQTALPKLVFRGEEDDLVEVEVFGGDGPGDGYYTWEYDSGSTAEGWVYRDRDSRNRCGDPDWVRLGIGRGDDCYELVTDETPRLVYIGEDLVEVDVRGNTGPGDGYYEWVTTDDPIEGWVYRDGDRRNQCAEDAWVRLEIGGGDDCYELVTQPEFETEIVYTDGPVGEQCTDVVTSYPGEWQALDDDIHQPPHVDCVDDVNNDDVGNGPAQGDGYPQIGDSAYGVTADDQVDWGDNAYTFYTSHYLNWLYDDSLVEDRTRMAIAQDVVSSLISTNKSIDFGLLEFNGNWSGENDHGGRIVSRIIEQMNDADRDNVVNMVNQMTASGSTPLCEASYEAYRYLAGESVYFGDNDDGDRNGDILPRDLQAEEPVGTYDSPTTDCAYTYIIIMTDGYPQNDTSANDEIESLTGKTCAEYATDSQGSKKNCLPELAKYMSTTDLDGDETNGKQFGITYTIGFATDQDLLRDTATNGGGKYYTANNADELTNAFQDAFISILESDTTFTSPAVAVDTFTRTQSRDEVFYAMFKPSNNVNWTGNIKKLRLMQSGNNAILVDVNDDAAIDPATGYIDADAVTFWNSIQDGGSVEKGGVGALLASRDPSTRSVYINTGVNGALQAFNATNITAQSMNVADDDALYSLFGASTAGGFAKQINWALGYDAYDEDGDDSTDDNRKWVLADILHSQPLVINYGARGGFTEENPDMRLVVGTNSGFVHMFGNSDGVEDWAFFPKELAGLLPQRRRNALSGDNIYGMDLTPVSFTYDANGDGTLSGGSDKVWAYFGMRRGGSSYHALDLSDPDSPSFMWRIGSDTAGFSEMGQTWSEPVVTRIPGYRDNSGIPKPVLIFGAGYDTDKDGKGLALPDSVGRGLFIVDAETGALVWSITPAANSATNLSESALTHSVAAGVTVLDSNGDELTDRIYFGDTGGNLWRVDLPGNSLPSASQDTWQINKLADFNYGAPASDRRFFNSPDLVRIRFDGEPVDAIVMGSGDRTNPNGTDVDNQLYMIRDLGVRPYSTPRPNAGDCYDGNEDFRCQLPLTEDDLFDITSNVLTTGTDEQRVVAREALRTASGWKLDLEHFGEKSLAKTLTINGKIYAPTFTPASILTDINICVPQSGKGRMYIIDLYNGDREVIDLGPIIPDTPSVHFGKDGKIRLLLPPGTPPGDLDDGDECEEGEDCEPRCPRLENGVLIPCENMPAPYGNYWFQEDY